MSIENQTANIYACSFCSFYLSAISCRSITPHFYLCLISEQFNLIENSTTQKSQWIKANALVVFSWHIYTLVVAVLLLLLLQRIYANQKSNCVYIKFFFFFFFRWVDCENEFQSNSEFNPRNDHILVFVSLFGILWFVCF